MTKSVVLSRAAVAGNPSDGFDGAVCSVILPMFSATVEVLDRGTNTAVDDGTIDLITATIHRFAIDVHAVDVDVSFSTTIPRAVGLAGSSAIVIAVLTALNSHVGTNLKPMDIAELAHAVERADLGIAGGWQDQLVQSHGYSALVECAEPRRVEPMAMRQPAIPLYLAWSETAAESSGHAHTALQTQRPPDGGTIAELAELGRQAAASFATRNVHSLKEAINTTFDIRRTIMDIVPTQVEMVDTARAFGASANFAGSGGAILGVLPKNGDEFLEHMRQAGYDVAHWEAQ